MGGLFDLFVGETMELIANQGQCFVKAGVTISGAARLRRDQFAEALSSLLAVGFGSERLNSGNLKRMSCIFRNRHIVGPHDLVLAHGDAAPDLRQVLAERALQYERFQFAEAAVFI